MEKIYSLEDIKNLNFKLKSWDIIFLKWDLWAWKTTLSKHIINNLLKVKNSVTSPTYTYYNKYKWFLGNKKITIFHFDLYRLSNYDEFFAIWWEEILDNNTWIILIEWPELIEKYYKANLEVFIKKLNNDKRKLIITK